MARGKPAPAAADDVLQLDFEFVGSESHGMNAVRPNSFPRRPGYPEKRGKLRLKRTDERMRAIFEEYDLRAAKGA